MSFYAVVLLLFSALLHATWNLFLKKSVSKQAFAWWMLVWASLLTSPVLWIEGFDVSRTGWYCLAASTVAETLYFLTLCWGYEIGDLSIVYPLARGSAPIFIATWAFVFIGERPTPLGWGGIALIVAGVYLVNTTSMTSLTAPFRTFKGPTVRMALSTGLFISMYSVIDKVGVQESNPLVYFNLLFTGMTIVLTPYMWRTLGATVLFKEWNANRWYIIAAAASAAGSYGLILYLLTFTKVSYIGAARSISVVFGVLLGWLHLREGFGSIRTFAAILIFAGMACLAMTE